MLKIDALQPFAGKPSDSNRKAWLNYAGKLKCAYLVLVQLPAPLNQCIPRLIQDKQELFYRLQLIKRDYNHLTMELYNLELPYAPQVEDPLLIGDSEPPAPDPEAEYSEHHTVDLPQLQGLYKVSSELSQFELELWFQRGISHGAKYMVIAENKTPPRHFYPIYSNESGLADLIIHPDPERYRFVVTLFRLRNSFRHQYMNSVFSQEDKPGNFYSVREETLPTFMNDEELEGFRRRLMDFFCYAQLTAPESQHCLGSALELLNYGKQLAGPKRACAMHLLRNSLNSALDNDLAPWQVFPYRLLLCHYLDPGSTNSGFSYLYDPDPKIRSFGMTCQSLFPVNFGEVCDAFKFYYRNGYELRGLLHLLWGSEADTAEKLKFIQEQLIVVNDPFAGPWEEHVQPSPEMIKELYLYLKPEQMPDPLAEELNRYHRFKKTNYHKDNNLFYALHTDSTPRLQLIRERKLCEKKARQGDLTSILHLGAYYLWCEGEYGDCPKAVKWLKAGAKLGHPTALCLLGWVLWRGTGLARDRCLAIDLLTQSAQTGYATVYYYLSLCYESGDPAFHDDVRSYAYLLVAHSVLEDYTMLWSMEERLSYFSRSLLNPAQRQESLDLANKIVQLITPLDTEPVAYMAEASQRILAENSIHRKWGKPGTGSSDLPISQL